MMNIFSNHPLKIFLSDRTFLIISGKGRFEFGDSQLIILLCVDVLSQGLVGILNEEVISLTAALPTSKS